MKGLISKITLVVLLLGISSRAAFAFTQLPFPHIPINPGLIQNAISNLNLISEDQVRNSCTKNIDVTKPDDLTCKEAIQGCVTIYENNCLLNPNNQFNCTEFSIASDGSKVFKCEVDAAHSCDNFIDLIQSLFDRITNSCTDPTQNPSNIPSVSQTPPPPATTTDVPSNNTPSNADTMSPTGTNPNAGATSGCSLSPLQGSTSFAGTGILSTLMMIPFSLRMRKKN